MSKHQSLALVPVFALALAAFGCNSSDGPVNAAAGFSESTASLPDANGAPAAGPKTVGPSCAGKSTICLGLKYVAFEDSSGKPAVSQAVAIQNIQGVNAIWQQCGIAFQIEDFQSIRPSDFSLSSSGDSFGTMDAMRSAFTDPSEILLISLTGTVAGADAWTNSPGLNPGGSVLDANVATYVPVIAHELGHYVGLDHVGSTSQLMTPAPYTTSTLLTSSECATSVATAQNVWGKMLR